MNLWLRSICFFDRLFGLRAWGIYLYGVLPANLSLIGVLDVKIGNLSDMAWSIIIAVSIAPLLIVFLFIRNKQREWYICTSQVNVRSVVVTVIVLCVAWGICGCAGIIKDKYVWDFPEYCRWEEWCSWEARSAMVESFLMGLASLVLTSTFFMAILVKDMNIPGIASKETIELITKLRTELIAMISVEVWESGGFKRRQEALNAIQKVQASSENIMHTRGNYFVKRTVVVLEEDVSKYKELVTKFNEASNDTSRERLWRICFGQEVNISAEERASRANEQQKLDSLNRIRSLRLGN